MSDEKFLEKYEELLNKDYCNCNEMNCIDNNSPRRILNIAKKQKEVIDKIKEYLEEPNRDNFDFSKAKILEMIEEIYE